MSISDRKVKENGSGSSFYFF